MKPKKIILHLIVSHVPYFKKLFHFSCRCFSFTFLLIWLCTQLRRFDVIVQVYLMNNGLNERWVDCAGKGWQKLVKLAIYLMKCCDLVLPNGDWFMLHADLWELSEVPGIHFTRDKTSMHSWETVKDRVWYQIPRSEHFKPTDNASTKNVVGIWKIISEGFWASKHQICDCLKNILWRSL